MRSNASRPQKATDSDVSAPTTHGGSPHRDLRVETVDGGLTAVVTITGMGRGAQQIVEEIDSAIRSELDNLVRDDE
jgi:hypothetical protein